ncbi:uncharacterized protein [Phyllobates terribilis]|uniref:uncharacterized protein isoform X2 n=1 Tax=Phyllobates terribilis TaxID=111132 RepID=UPI003CCAD1F6
MDRSLASSSPVLLFSAGDAVTFSCSDESNTIRNVSQITLIVWRKENGFHVLRFVSDKRKNASNFTDPRISFLSAEIPPMLQIRDARAEDAGDYTCEIITELTSSSSGRIHRSWTLHISDSSSYKTIYISCSVTGAVVILVIIAGIVYWKFCTNHNTIPSQIHQTSTENTEKEEPVYDNIQEDYFLRFNTLYERTLAVPMAPRLDNP